MSFVPLRYDALKVSELRRLCGDRGLSTTVKRGLDAKSTLTERLRESDGGGGA